MQELMELICEHFGEFKANHEKAVEKNNKSAARRARKSLGEVKKLVVDYRKASTAFAKAL
jgi:hypothetical protein